LRRDRPGPDAPPVRDRRRMPALLPLRQLRHRSAGARLELRPLRALPATTSLRRQLRQRRHMQGFYRWGRESLIRALSERQPPPGERSS
jgi:hypothetical protein